MHRRTLLMGLGAAVLVPRPADASAAYPDHAVRLIVPFAPGSSVGINARRLQPYLERTLGQPVNLEFHQGSGGMAGHLDGVQAQADGYTLTLISATLSVQPWLSRSSTARPDDFAFVGQVTSLPSVVLVRANSPYRVLADLVAAGRVARDALSTGNLMSWWPPALAQSLFFKRAGISPRIVASYYSGADMLVTLSEGGLDFAIVGLSDVSPSLTGGALRPLAVSAHSAVLPATPSFREQGWDVPFGWWRGLAVPKATPDAVVGRLSAALRQALDDPGLREDFARSGLSVDPFDGPLFRQAVLTEYQTIGDLLTSLGINKQTAKPF
jgi:tripartite-type tricarboxylate transporter receptor subunit TctC